MDAMNTIEISPRSLSGTLSIPPSKSMSHRAIIAASLSAGRSRISNVILSQDILATIEGMRAFGAQINLAPHVDRWTLSIQGVALPQGPKAAVDCGESGSTLRFLLPLATLVGREVVFTGKGKLRERPLGEYYSIFERDGVSYENQGGNLPLTINGRLKGGVYPVRGDVSSQFISGLLICLPLLERESEIILTTPLESSAYVEMTLQILRAFGIEIQNPEKGRYRIPAGQEYQPLDYRVEGDFSQCAFWLVAGALSREKEGNILCKDVHPASLQGDKEIIPLLRRMGARIEENSDHSIRVSPGPLHGIEIDASEIPDIIPILSVALVLSQGKGRITRAGRLRLKESDRLKAMVTELGRLGACIKEVGDEIHIEGRPTLQGGAVSSWKDHRIAMALAIASIGCEKPVLLQDARAVTKSYPHFFEDFTHLGGKISGREDCQGSNPAADR